VVSEIRLAVKDEVKGAGFHDRTDTMCENHRSLLGIGE
jgi:hypothetical protein